MAPFEALYGRRYRTPINWIEPGERTIFGPDLVIEAEEIVHRILEFEVGDRAYLRVSPTQGVKRFGIKGKLAPRYIGPFLILARLGNVAYRLKQPPALASVHNAFHVS
jgi:hypothetical protein